ncbi:MAG: hypothetical protein IJT69_00275 [Clostridia bacterium]|nr:hypothetical protein [Clostridia bacterium]
MKTLFLYLIRSGADERPLAGLTPYEWLLRGAQGTPCREIADESEATLPKGAGGVAILYWDTPLVRASDLMTLLGEMDRRGIDGYEIGAGSLRTAAAFRRGALPKRRCVAPFAERLSGEESRGGIERALYRRIAETSVQNGAIITDVDSVRIDAKTRLEAGAIVEPFAIVVNSFVGKGARIGSFSTLENATVGAGAEIVQSVVRDSAVGASATVGPFAYLRMGARVGEGARIGDFVEVKKSTLAAGVKAAHLAYIGDAEVGAGTNVGCGTVFANYDGKVKRETRIGERVFIGANTNLVAPLTVGDDAYIAAASTVTRDVPAGAFVIGRVRQEVKEKRRE